MIRCSKSFFLRNLISFTAMPYITAQQGDLKMFHSFTQRRDTISPQVILFIVIFHTQYRITFMGNTIPFTTTYYGISPNLSSHPSIYWSFVPVIIPPLIKPQIIIFSHQNSHQTSQFHRIRLHPLLLRHQYYITNFNLSCYLNS